MLDRIDLKRLIIADCGEIGPDRTMYCGNSEKSGITLNCVCQIEYI